MPNWCSKTGGKIALPDSIVFTDITTATGVESDAATAATGKRVSRSSAAFFKVRDGKVAEGHVFADGAGFMAQLTGNDD